MCSFSYIQPQFAVPVSHLASVWNSVRGWTQTTTNGRAYTSRRSASMSSSASPDDTTNNLFVDSIGSVFEQLGFKDIPRECDKELLNVVLGFGAAYCRQPSREHNVSASTFFENKYGFAEQLLQKALHRPTSDFNIGSTSRYHHLLQPPTMLSFSLQSTRSFKTRHSGSATGFGGKKPGADDFPAIKFLKDSVFSKLSGANVKSNEKLRTLISSNEMAPGVQEKLKIAFAEGYVANDKGRDVPPSAANTWSRRIARFMWYGLIVWIIIQLLQTYTAMGGNMKINVLKGERFEINPEEITITFDDVKGIDEAKQELKDIVEFLRDPEKFQALGAKLPKGVLLVGPPGIGKSLLARAVAGEAGVPFFHASGSEFDEIFVGTGAKRVRQLFDAAKMRAPCIVFIDEIDTVGAKRTSSQIHPYANQTINQLLSEMDGFQQNEGVIVLGATNRRDNLDKALLRPGRFDVEVRVFPPDLKGRKDILDHYLTKVKIGTDVDVDKVARSTTGCTGADLENMVNQAALKAAMDGDKAVAMAHMEFARDKVLMGPAKKTKIPDEETNNITAYHEAGHTLVAFYTKDATPLNKVTIIPRGMSLGHTSFVPDKEQYNQTRSQLLAQMDIAMGGRVAEELIFGADKVTTGASADFQQATSIATAMVKSFGMSEKVGVRVFHEEDIDTGMSFLKLNEVGPATTEVVDNEIKRLLQESYERARNVLKSHQSEHKALAQALLKYETLDADDLQAVIDGKPLHRSGPTLPTDAMTTKTPTPRSTTLAPVAI